MRGLFRLFAGLALWVGVCTPAMAQLSPDWTQCVGGPRISKDQSIAACTRIIDGGKETGENLAIAFNNRGLAYYDKGDLTRAIADYDQAIRLKPDYATAFYKRGLVYLAKGDLTRAIADFDQAIRLKPDYAFAFNNRGNAYVDKGDLTRAIRDYDQAIRLKPDYFEAFYNRGLVHYAKGDPARAIDDFDTAIRLNPRYSAAFYNLGNAYRKDGQVNRAIESYGQAIRLKPDFVEAFVGRGLAFADKGDFTRAIQDLDQAIRIKPDYTQAFYIRGLAYYDKGDLTRAIRDFDHTIGLKPDYGVAYVNRGRAYLKLEQIDRAIADLEKGFSLAPNLGDWAKSALAEARAKKIALASRATSATRRVAMIIGNGQYPYIGNLKNAENDAVKIAAALKGRGYEIIGPNGTAAPFANQTKAQMEAALDAFQKQSETAEVALIWYAGHGSSFQIADQQKDNFLLPIDFRTKDAKDILVKGLSVERMKRAVIPAARLRVLIIDACRDNNVEVPTRGLKRGMIAEAKNRDMVVMFSTRAGEQAEDGDGDLSPFAEGFLEELAANPKNAVLNFLTAVSGRVKAKTDPDQIPEIFTNVTDPKLTLVK